jgi:hypothetical protein
MSTSSLLFLKAFTYYTSENRERLQKFLNDEMPFARMYCHLFPTKCTSGMTCTLHLQLIIVIIYYIWHEMYINPYKMYKEDEIWDKMAIYALL